MSSPDKIFKDKLYNLETPLGGGMSFDKVMAMRNNKTSPVWWKPTLLVVATLSVVSLTGFFWLSNGSSSSKPEVAASNTNSNANNSGGGMDNSNSNTENNAVANNNNSNIKEPTGTNNSNVGDGIPTIANGSQSSSGRSVNPTQGTAANQGVSNGNGNHDKPTKHSIPPVVAFNEVPRNVDVAEFPDHSGLDNQGIDATLFDYPAILSQNLNPAVPYPDLMEKQRLTLPTFEVMMYTGALNQNKFDANSSYSIRGSHRSGIYSAVALWDLNQGMQLGAGIGFAQFMGNGKWQNTHNYIQQNIHSRTVTIVQPGFPDRQITVYDTTNTPTTDVTQGDITYNLSKLSVPLAFRMHFGEGRTLLRASATIAPGMLLGNSGTLFNRETSLPLTQKIHNPTLDAKIGLGAYYLLSTKLAVVVEPSVAYQSILGNNLGAYNRFNFGLGFGLVIKP